MVETGVDMETCTGVGKSYAKYIDITVEQVHKRKLCPFKVEKFLQRELNINYTTDY